jgi:hypothetical protein
MIAPPASRATTGQLFRASLILGVAATLIIPINTALFFLGHVNYPMANLGLAFVQLVLGTIAAVLGLKQLARSHGLVGRGGVLALSIVSVLVALGGGVALGVGIGALWQLEHGHLLT